MSFFPAQSRSDHLRHHGSSPVFQSRGVDGSGKTEETHNMQNKFTQTRHDSLPIENSPRRPLPQVPNLKPKAAYRTPTTGTTDKQLPPRPSSANERHGRTRHVQESESPILRSQSLERNFLPIDSQGRKPRPRTPTSPSSRRSSEAMKKIQARQGSPYVNRAAKSLSMNHRIKQIITEKGIDTINVPGRKRSEESLGSISIGYVTPDSTSSSIRGYIREQSDVLLQYKDPQNGAERPIGSFAHVASQSQPTNPYPTLELQFQSNSKIVTNDTDLWVRPRYLSGPIVTDPTFGLYAIPAMTAMDVLYHTAAITDEQIVDEIVDFYESYDFPPVISDLDNYWMKSEVAEAEVKVPTPVTSPLGGNAPKPLAANLFLTQVDPPAVGESSAFSDSSLGYSQLHTTRISSALPFLRGGERGAYHSSHVTLNDKADLNTQDQQSSSSAHRGSTDSLRSSDHHHSHSLSFQQGSSSAPPSSSLPTKPPPAASSSLGRAGSRVSSDWSPRSLSSASTSAAAAAASAPSPTALADQPAATGISGTTTTGTAPTTAGVGAGRSIFNTLWLGQGKRNSSTSSGGSGEKAQSPKGTGSGQYGRFSVKKFLDMGASSSAYDVYSQGR
jgi:hypothetical protein